MSKISIIRAFLKTTASFSAAAAVTLATCASLGAQETRQLDRDRTPASENRTALVIGNSAYESSPLANPVNDATDIAAALRSVGFEVISGNDQSRAAMVRLVRQFGERLKARGGVGLFYYAGHGLQVDGRNYLVPVDAAIRTENEVELEAVDVSRVLVEMENAANPLNIVILDACRNNPFSRSWRSTNGGLAQINAPSGTLIGYATAPGTVASDGKGRNAPYTAALVRAIRMPGLSLPDVFAEVGAEVQRETNKKQTPWVASSVTGRFYFVPPSGTTTTATTAPDVEQEYWDAVKGSSRAADFEGYLKEYPNGRYAAVARVRIAQLGGKTETKPETVPAKLSGAVAPGTVRKTPAGIELVWIPPGEFMMGSDMWFNEKPVRKVMMGEGFWMGRYEVTQAQWEAVMGSNPSYFKNCGPSCPVEQVSWNDAKDFIARLNARGDGWVYSLPSEAEWEYAARAGTTGVRYGNLDDVAWYGNNSGRSYIDTDAFWKSDYGNFVKRIADNGNQTKPIGGKQPNAFGLYDILGNVFEWAEDVYSMEYTGLASDGSANMIRGDAEFRVFRGGSWRSYALEARSAFRGRESQSNRANGLGFRVVARPR